VGKGSRQNGSVASEEGLALGVGSREDFPSGRLFVGEPVGFRPDRVLFAGEAVGDLTGLEEIPSQLGTFRWGSLRAFSEG